MVGVFGLRGELKVAASRIGEDAIAAGVEVRATLRDGASRALRVRAVRYHLGRPLVAFDGVGDPDSAAALVGATLFVDRAGVPLGDDEYFDDDLIGCALVASDGAVVGDVTGVEHYPAQDVVTVALPGGGRGMVPLVKAFVRRIDIAAKRIDVELPPGLLDPGEAEEA